MNQTPVRSTIYFDPAIHHALKLKAVHSRRSVSDIVNDAVREALEEDREDLSIFDERIAEPTMSYQELLDDLKTHGKI